ncbi:autotransporter domain-containing protein [Novilysobacter selenitireducens]|uniref:Autotransporter domain-containing protein n=1 Tax=Novilysobacter selenitireducens TaxID=2872639 RepID=A0ABS7T713_9GAMM|nr:autotransporter domain-containing protein [Lysobacter selenitireducens]MBZ4039633.1 autotransporter domain-containing protein [Lysobacter selenitireducens]
MLLASANFDPAVEAVTIRRSNGADFILTGLQVDVTDGTETTVQGYRDGATVGAAQVVAPYMPGSLAFSDLIVDEVRISSTDFYFTKLDDFSGNTEVPQPPSVTDANIRISGASGTGGAYRLGDTVIADWNNTASGDDNMGVTGVTVDFSQFGGGAAVAATNSSGTWTATYTLGAGAIDAANRNVSVTASNVHGATPRADSTNATVDTIAPVVTDGNISLSGGTGTGGAFKIGDTVTAVWNNTAGGDNNSDNISAVTIDFSQFGGGAAVAATNSAGTWTATYTLVAGAIDATNRNTSVTAVDNAGNATTRADTSNTTVDTTVPAVTSVAPAGGAISADTTVAFTVTFNESISGVSADDFSLTSTGSASGSIASVSASGGTSVDVTVNGISGSGTLRVDLNSGTDIQDDAGNGPPVAFTGGTAHAVDILTAPGAPTVGAATPGDGQVSIAFTAPADDGGSAITGYTVTSSPGSISASGAGSPLVVSGLTNGTAYTFTVTATNAVGSSVASSASASVTPQADQTITFNNPGAQNFGTTPTLTATSSAGAGYLVSFSSSTTGVCTITGGGTLTFVAAGTCTVDADQAGDAATAAAATVSRSFTVNAVVPGVPTTVTATAGDTQASVAFIAPANAGGTAITGYTVTANPGGATASGMGSPVTLTGLTNGVAYTFTVTAHNSAGTGAASMASNSVTPAAVQTITFTNPGAQNFGTIPTLTATSSAGAGYPISFSSSTTGVCTITSGGTLTFITAGTCTINADQAGDASYLPATQVSRSFIVNPVIPGAPTGVTAVAGNTQATVSFGVPASTGGSAITGYSVTANPGGATVSGASSPLTVTGLSNGVAYTFTVTADNVAGTGAASMASNAVTPAPSLVTASVSLTVAYGAAATPVTLDITGTPTSVAVDAAPAHGTALANGTTITYQPAPGYAGPDSFTYTASDGLTTSAAATVTVTVQAASVALDATAPADAAGSTAYTHVFTASGGIAPYTFVQVAGELPAGLALAADGTLSGTPTQAGTFAFTIEATDASTGTGPFSAQQAYTLSVQAPAIALAMATPEITFGDGIDQTLQVTGGTAPYTFAVVDGALPPGVALSTAGVLSGTPTAAGRFEATVEVRDANDFAARQAIEIAVEPQAQAITGFAANPDAPVFAPGGTFALTAQGGASGNAIVFASTTTVVCTVAADTVTMLAAGRCGLTADQAGDANHSAAAQVSLEVDIAAAVPTLVWPEQLSKVLGEAAFALDNPGSDSAGTFTFTSSQPAVASIDGRTVTLRAAGTTVITATQAADGNYTIASIQMELVVVERPDPTRDPGVTGLLQAQVDASVRFATAQQANIRDRLRQVRNGANASSSNLTLAYAGGDTGAGLSLPLGQAAASPWPAMPQGWGAWLSGTATFGSSGRSNGFDFETDGITLGADRAIGENLIVGIAGSLATNDSTLDANGASHMQADQRSLALYGLWRAGEHLFVDAVAGTGQLDFDLQRWSTDADALGTATREGDQWFASVSMGYAHHGPSMSLTGYGRVDTSRTTLEAYREYGLALYDLAYREQVVDHSAAAIGLEGQWQLGEAGRVRPFWSVEYRQALEDKGDAAINYVLMPAATDYRLRMSSYNDNALSLSAGLDLTLRRGWLLSLLLGHEQARNASEASSIGLRLSYGGQPAAVDPVVVPDDDSLSRVPEGDCRNARCRNAGAR